MVVVIKYLKDIGNKKFPEVSYVKTPAKKVTSKVDIEASNILNQKNYFYPYN